MVDNRLNIFDDVQFDDHVTKIEYHSYYPYLSSGFNNDDEIRIPIQSSDIYTLPHESYLYLEGTFESTDKDVTFPVNAFAFLFDEIRYELNGVEIDRTRDVGISSLMKNLASLNNAELNQIAMSGFDINTSSIVVDKQFNTCIPLQLLLGFCEMYKKIIVNSKQELVLLRTRNDTNFFVGKDGTVKISKIYWAMPHLHVNDEIKLKLFRHIKVDNKIVVPFRKWELHETTKLQNTLNDKWQIRTSTQLEKPRYIIIAFQTNKKNVAAGNASEFDHANIRSIKVYLNTESYPYDKQDFDFEKKKYAVAYYNYSQFQNSKLW